MPDIELLRNMNCVMCMALLMRHIDIYVGILSTCRHNFFVATSHPSSCFYHRLLKMLAAQFTIIFALCITQGNSCVIFEMYQGKCEEPMYYQQYGPTETGLNLFNCAQWCMVADMCKSILGNRTFVPKWVWQELRNAWQEMFSHRKGPYSCQVSLNECMK